MCGATELCVIVTDDSAFLYGHSSFQTVEPLPLIKSNIVGAFNPRKKTMIQLAKLKSVACHRA